MTDASFWRHSIANRAFHVANIRHGRTVAVRGNDFFVNANFEDSAA